MDELLRLCETFIRADSRNKSGNTSLARIVAGELERLGFSISFQNAKLAGASQVNLIAHHGKHSQGPLLLNTHLDTVDTNPDAWTRTDKNPFNPTLIRGRLYGLGTADTKLALACQLIALRQLDLSRLRRPIIITGTYGEEMGLVGVQQLIRKSRLQPAFAVNSEPTGLKLSNGNFGFRIYRMSGFQLKSTRLEGYHHEIQFSGQAAHSAVREFGHNAIESALHWLHAEAKDTVLLKCVGGIAPNIMAPHCSMEVLSTVKKFKSLRAHRGRSLQVEYRNHVKGYPGLSAVLQGLPRALRGVDRARESSNFGLIEYDSGQFEGFVSHRFAPQLDPDQEFKRWSRGMRALAVNGVHASLSIQKDNAAFRQGAQSSLVRSVRSVLKEMKKDTSLFLKPGCTEALYLSKLGCDVVTIGPGESYGNIHAPNESIRVKDLKEAVSFYQRLIRKICF